jgi:molybdopterin-guanine dinucleotide biosynthesis protein A
VKVLGAILAGGQSRRFGSDKAAAIFEGKALLDHVADSLQSQVEALVVAGRDWPGRVSVSDLPEPGLGPLSGLCGALTFANQNGFDAVLSSGCDLIGIPENLIGTLGHGPAIIDDQPLLGLWPASLAEILLSWLERPNNRSVFGFADHIGAQRIALDKPIRNANRPEDLQ